MIDARGPEQQRRVGVCNAGTCVVLGLVMGGWLYTAHVGDCRAVLGKASGRSVDGHGRARSTPVASVDELEESVGLGAARDEGADMQAVQLTADHNCSNTHEVAAVRARCTTDPNPIRCSRNDVARAAVSGRSLPAPP